MRAGLNQDELKEFSDLLTKANDLQLQAMTKIILEEPLRRIRNMVNALEEKYENTKI